MQIVRAAPRSVVRFSPKRDSHASADFPKAQSQSYYVGLTDVQLLDELKRSIGNVCFSRQQITCEMRERLLPALVELKRRTYRKKPGFYEVLATIGLNGAVYRQWVHRSQSEVEATDLLADMPHRRRVPRPHERDDGDTLLIQHACKLALAVRRNQPKDAWKLAGELLEAARDRHPLSVVVSDEELFG